MPKNNIFASVVSSVIAAVVVLGLFLSGSKPSPATTPAPAQNFGSTVETVRVTLGQGFDALAGSSVSGPITQNRTLATSSTAATGNVLLASQLATFSTILYTPLVTNTNIYLPASTTFPYTFLPKAGDRTQLIIFNATTTSGIKIGIVPGAGSLVATASTTILGVAATASTTATNAMVVHILRKPNTDLLYMISAYQAQP